MLLERLLKLIPTRPVYAHCDIPCGIYDPHQMQMAAHTIIRMTKLLMDLEVPGNDAEAKEFTNHHNSVVRMVTVKEKHAHICEEEIETLWADYFKPEHYTEYSDLLELINSAIKLTGKVKQEVNLEASQELLAKTQQIAEIFWKTKKLEPVRIPSGYPTEGEIVSHK